MAIKVSRTHGLRVLMEKCGCKATREFEDYQMTKAVGEVATYTPCDKHKTVEEAAATIQEILFEMLETAQTQAQKQVAPNVSMGHSVEDVAAAQAAGGTGATRTPIKRVGPGGAGAGRTSVRRSGGDGTSLPRVSAAVMESRAAGGGASIDAELARSPEPSGPPRLGPVSRQAVQDAMEEAAADGEPVTALDVILGVNDDSGRI